MPEIQIDRLTLRLSGLSESDGRRLAELIGEGLAAAQFESRNEERGHIESRLTMRPGSDIRGMAEQAVADVIRQLQRSA